MDLILLKVVICQVPTTSRHYTDFKLIALFDRGVAYLWGSADCRWTLLPSKSCIDGDPQFCDAIEHNGIIYAIDNANGTTCCWDASCKLFSSDFNDNAITLFELLWWLAYPCYSRIWVELWQCIRDAVNQEIK
jgi:hypothetical protein